MFLCVRKEAEREYVGGEEYNFLRVRKEAELEYVERLLAKDGIHVSMWLT